MLASSPASILNHKLPALGIPSDSNKAEFTLGCLGCTVKVRRHLAGRSPSMPPIGSVVAIDFLAALVAFLGIDAERRDRPCLEPFQADRVAGLLA